MTFDSTDNWLAGWFYVVCRLIGVNIGCCRSVCVCGLFCSGKLLLKIDINVTGEGQASDIRLVNSVFEPNGQIIIGHLGEIKDNERSFTDFAHTKCAGQNRLHTQKRVFRIYSNRIFLDIIIEKLKKILEKITIL